MRWTDIAPWIGPTPNEDPGAMGEIIGVVLHIQDGTQAGSIAWCKNPDSRVSAHFFAPKQGRPVQLVDTADLAWAEAAGNPYWISIENEGYSGDSLSADQIEACAQILARAHIHYGVSLQEANTPLVGGLGWHGMGGEAWGGHPDCPGEPVKDQRAGIIARARTIAGQPLPTPTAPPFRGRTLVYVPGGVQDHGDDVTEWQQRMHARGWTITVDGWYGPASENVCVRFQEDSNAHGWPLVVDGMVGPKTWAATWERPVS